MSTLTPISIQQLPVAPLPLEQTDLVIVSRGTNSDYQSTIGSVWAINLSVFPNLAQPSATDLMLVYHNSGVYNVLFQDVALVAGTRQWFYQQLAPAGWAVVAVPNDAVLGVVDSSGAGQFSTGGVQLNNVPTTGTGTGTWSMTGNQLPSHSHPITSTRTPGVGLGGFVYEEFANTSTVGSSTNNNISLDYGTWRPVTAIGIICVKL